ncbi:adenosine deaminase, partial [Salmonella enterica subsp. enterica serovar Anatum str. CFSAN003974]|nr:adenosine deaminase [Salmonella enterica subsp. enterica serovar Anatum str. CFSAN003974]
KKWPRRKIALLMLTPSLRLRFNAIPGGEIRHLRQDTASRDVLPIPCPVQSTP